MRRFLFPLLVGCFVLPLLLMRLSQADEETKPAAHETPAADTNPAAASVEELARRVRDSVVMVTVTGRKGEGQHVGAGFCISQDGLIATNQHVIGSGRAIEVQFADGRTVAATEVYASDRNLDLALIRVAEKLPPLELADSDLVNPGAAVIVIGNPHGLKHSVVSGVVSGRRVFDGLKMLQLAIPVEPGNSGGPVLDMQGRVLGIVTRKSAVSDNLGFAIEINTLKKLVEQPNPISMANWLTIGKLDPKRWQPLFGADWRRRGGQLNVTDAGQGFGGRSLCLWSETPPEIPYEVGVFVRLDDEAGAAGLVFHADGGDRHFGFYPSNGNLRLVRFDGPNVLTWNILENAPAPHYRPNDWNHLKVRIEKDRILCYVNDRLTFTSTDRGLSGGQVGLAKFRQTEAAFKRFQLAKTVALSQPSAEKQAALGDVIDALPPIEELVSDSLTPLVDDAAAGAEALRRRAKDLEKQAAAFRRIANEVRAKFVARQLAALFQQEEKKVELDRAALLVAALDEEDLDIESYLEELDRMSGEAVEKLAPAADDAAKIAALNNYLFVQNGYHGNRFSYYHRANSYLDRVIDDREGLPITLAVMYLELARRLDLNVEGVGLPGHFVVRWIPREGPPQLLDIFAGGKELSDAEADNIIAGAGLAHQKETLLKNADKKSILLRMLNNLLAVAQGKKDNEAVLRYLEAKLAIAPDAFRDRGLRAFVRYETDRRQGAIADLEKILEQQPPELDLHRIRDLRDAWLQQP